ncbi:MAG: YheU family protein [Deltaproteobacteria bacterium]|nr:YheU family protein [Deltaproteobacteria bacterium]
MEVPFRMLSEDALNGLIEEFVTREGTDYGQTEYSLEKKALVVRRQLETGKAVIVFDEETGTCNIIPKE